MVQYRKSVLALSKQICKWWGRNVVMSVLRAKVKYYIMVSAVGEYMGRPAQERFIQISEQYAPLSDNP